MKYVVVLADGAADTPVKELNGQTPLEAADLNLLSTALQGTAKSVWLKRSRIIFLPEAMLRI